MLQVGTNKHSKRFEAEGIYDEPGYDRALVGARIDLVITNLTEYRSWENNGRKWNGLKREDGEGHTAGAFGSGGFGSVNLKGPRSPTQSGYIWRERATYVELQYDFVTGPKESRTPIKLARTYLTFYDFDRGRSQVTDPINVGATEAMHACT